MVSNDIFLIKTFLKYIREIKKKKNIYIKYKIKNSFKLNLSVNKNNLKGRG